MTRWPITFPWLAQFALAVALACALGFVLVGGLAVVRWWRARRALARPGYVDDFWPPRSERWFR